jgi:sulfofructose kinase
MGNFDVIACGINVVDNMVVLPETVRRNEKHAVSQLIIQGGGPGPNQACGLAALGWRTAFLTRHGPNTISRIAEAEFVQCGVSMDLVIRDPLARPAVAVVEVDPRSGDRTVFYNLDHYSWLAAKDVPEGVVKQARLVITDGYERAAALRLLEIARLAGIPSVLDLEAGEADQIRPLLAAASHVILSLEGGRQATGRESPAEVLTALAQWTRAQMVVTDGVKGSWAIGPAGLIHQPAFRVAAVDSTGCGDAFHAAYASALLDGFSLPLRLEFSAWVASQVALALGSRTNLPTRKVLQAADQSALSADLRRELVRVL